MIKKIEEYLDQLKKELSGSDPALVQDALSDAEEHFRTALDEALERPPELSEADILQAQIEKYGTPPEIASAYKEIESRIVPTFAITKPLSPRSFQAKFFGVIKEARNWGALLYIFLSALTSLLFFMWVLLGGTFSLFSLVLIIGIPVTGFFLLSLRGIALLEGLIVEALLGVRMPRKPIFIRKGLNWRQKYKALATESYTWKAFAYLIVHFPLAWLHFMIMFVMIGFSIKSVFYPVWYWGLGRSLINIGQPFYPPAWSYPMVVLAGVLLFFAALHLAGLMGKIHGKFAKFMLVRKQV
ncbi:MAG: sensor domain-containing protein [Candidatus Aminicenantes bacterium]|nr:MAG: sensor domain-containing protein [Candidatus Aminicenantes bacterium]